MSPISECLVSEILGGHVYSKLIIALEDRIRLSNWQSTYLNRKLSVKCQTSLRNPPGGSILNVYVHARLVFIQSFKLTLNR